VVFQIRVCPEKYIASIFRVKKLNIYTTISKYLYLTVKLQGVLFQMYILLIASLPSKVKSKTDLAFNQSPYYEEVWWN